MAESERKKLLIIDGNSILNRAFYGVRPMTTRDGRPTNAIYGFINMILKPLETLRPDAAGVAFDLHAPTFRHKRFDYYKANRKGMPDDLAAQLDGAKEAAAALGLHVLSLAGFEADDILGTAAACAENDSAVDYDCYILTGDRDAFQLVGKKSFVLLCTNNDTVFYDENKIAETYGGLTPKKLIDLKALMGDNSDNIPGVPGIGEKTAVKLIAEFSDLDRLYENYDGASLSDGIKTKLRNGKASAYESRFLAEICRTVPLPLGFDDLKYDGVNRPALYTLLSSYELRSLLRRFGMENGVAAAAAASDAQAETASVTEAVPEDMDKPGCSALQIERFSASFDKSTLLGRLSVGKDGQMRFSVYPDFSESILYLAPVGSEKVLLLPASDEALAALFGAPDADVTVYDSKELCRELFRRNIPPRCTFFDVMLADYVVSPAAKGGAEELLTGATDGRVDLSEKTQKNGLLARLLHEKRAPLEVRLRADGLEKIYYEIELPLAQTLARMELAGFRIDRSGIAEYGDALELRLRERIANIYALSGGEFNVNSTKQLGEVLYDRLKLPALKKTKRGYSTDAETLEKLRPYHPIINEILDYRVVSKLKSTYVEGLLKEDGARIHTTFRQALTLTGRLSSVEPNLQNIPIKQPEGRELRKFFVAEPGNVLVDADYSQIELRILAALSKDKTMCAAFAAGEDIHAATASQVFGVPRDAVTPQMRKSAKAVNFGIVYGISDFSLAGDIGTTRKQAGEYIARYFEKYPDIRKYLDEKIAFAQAHGYVTTMFGRRRYIPELAAKNKVMQAFGKRVAMNSPIQGTAADIIKLAMIRTEKALREAQLSARLILQVHDELIVECKKEETDAVCGILRREMEGCAGADFPVPLEVSLSSGENWFDAHA